MILFKPSPAQYRFQCDSGFHFSYFPFSLIWFQDCIIHRKVCGRTSFFGLFFFIFDNKINSIFICETQTEMIKTELESKTEITFSSDFCHSSFSSLAFFQVGFDSIFNLNTEKKLFSWKSRILIWFYIDGIVHFAI